MGLVPDALWSFRQSDVADGSNPTTITLQIDFWLLGYSGS